jgi:hypothetical protein
MPESDAISAYMTDLYLWREWNLRAIEAPEGEQSVHGDARRYRLTAMYGGYGHWDAPMVRSRCRNADGEQGDVEHACAKGPVLTCLCGIYGWYTMRENLRQTACMSGEVFGFFQVMSGRAVQASLGMRVGAARPALLCINKSRTVFADKREQEILAEAMRDLKEDYGCEVLCMTIDDFIDEYAARDYQPAPLEAEEPTSWKVAGNMIPLAEIDVNQITTQFGADQDALDLNRLFQEKDNTQ